MIDLSERLTFLHGDCVTQMQSLPDRSIDAIVTDPPYPEIDRPYGTLSEPDWLDLMSNVCAEAKRVLKPTGSAVFIIAPNTKKLGQMRAWPYRFILDILDNWNLVQDIYWWNFATIPSAGSERNVGLLRYSVKFCVWAGPPNCYRNQAAVLWTESQTNLAMRSSGRVTNELKQNPSGHHTREKRMVETAAERGGVTPFNLLPFSGNGQHAEGHGARTPLGLCHWFVRYLCPPQGTVLDPFCGMGTVGAAALHQGKKFIGIDQSADYLAIAQKELSEYWQPRTKRGRRPLHPQEGKKKK